jgi:hypothetical protein
VSRLVPCSTSVGNLGGTSCSDGSWKANPEETAFRMDLGKVASDSISIWFRSRSKDGHRNVKKINSSVGV